MSRVSFTPPVHSLVPSGKDGVFRGPGVYFFRVLRPWRIRTHERKESSGVLLRLGRELVGVASGSRRRRRQESPWLWGRPSSRSDWGIACHSTTRLSFRVPSGRVGSRTGVRAPSPGPANFLPPRPPLGSHRPPTHTPCTCRCRCGGPRPRRVRTQERSVNVRWHRESGTPVVSDHSNTGKMSIHLAPRSSLDGSQCTGSPYRHGLGP